MKFKVMITLFLVSLLVVHPGSALSSPEYWPTEGWLSTTPEEHGMDSTVLTGMYDYIEANGLDMHSVVIIKNGYIVEETYPSDSYNQNTLHTIYSCTKSITSALIGIAIDQGYISGLDQKVLDFFPNREIANLDDQKQTMTIGHFLTMTSGMEWDEWTIPYIDAEGNWNLKNSLAQMDYSEDWVQYVLDRPMVDEPGKVFNYNTGTTHLLSAIIHQTTGRTTRNFAQEYLFDPLGITELKWPTDPQGIFEGGSALALKPRDMAKFGYLYLNNGKWEDEPIVPHDWFEISTNAQISASSHISGLSYGYQWWIYPELGVYAGLGWAGQQIFVIPDHELVVVFTGYNLNFVGHYATLIGDFIIPAVQPGVSEIPEIMPFILIFTIPGLLTMVIWNRRRH